MGWFRKKQDPLSERARALEAEIAALQEQIKQAESGVAAPSAPRLRAPALPGGAKTGTPAAPPAEPVFEAVDQHRLKTPAPVAPTSALPHPDLGLRQPGLSGSLLRLKRHFGLTPSSNPKLVKLLDSGQIQGLRPLRYEKRVARNRFILLSLLLLAVLFGLFTAILRSR